MMEDDLSLVPSMMPTPVSGIFEMKVVIGFIRKLSRLRLSEAFFQVVVTDTNGGKTSFKLSKPRPIEN